MTGLAKRVTARIAALLVVAGFTLVGPTPAQAAAAPPPAGTHASRLGSLNFDAYCRASGYSRAALTGAHAYGWRCETLTGGTADVDFSDVCAVQYDRADARAHYAAFYDPTSWSCWADVTVLGGADVDRFCRSKGYRSGVAYGGTAYSWRCHSSTGAPVAVNMLSVCRSQYAEVTLADPGYFYSPDHWRCWR
jgi:hypothetical protein